ncbi:MAG TPA: hypothetical protein VGP06_06100, partial [Janthinobacterium sp.]|nr:hypothetical protein [Janthinobacterium sp.]
MQATCTTACRIYHQPFFNFRDIYDCTTLAILGTGVPSLTLILVLGMRHGLDPDHLAAIDGLTLRTFAARPRWAPWMGGLFSMGHGIVILSIVCLAALASERFQPSPSLFGWLEWIPALLLLLLAIMNGRALLSTAAYPLASVRSRLFPRWLSGRSGPWSGVVLGMVFAAVFDTALQAAAWGYAATALGGMASALGVALIFSAGMAITDCFDGWVTARVMRTGRQEIIAAFRRRLGWPIVLMCAAIGIYMVLSKLFPAMEIVEQWYSILGG